MIKRAVALILLTGCGGPQSQPTATAPPTTQAVKAPFEYKIVKTDEKSHDMGPQVVVRLQTTNEIAKGRN